MNNMSNEEILEPIQNALYATNRFTTDECNTLADGILMYLKDAGYSISADQEKEKVAVTMEQTPIEKAIAEFNGLKAKAKSLRDVIYLDGVLAVLDSILPYEKKRDRKIAENAWDECFDSFLQHTPEFNGSIEDIEKDKQTYLN